MSRAKQISEWFQRTGGGGLELPDGWFGRPFDNIHQLTAVDEHRSALIVELDEALLLVFDPNVRIVAGSDALTFGQVGKLVFRWKEYGTDKVHLRTYDGGEVRLSAPPGA
jgi:hypothetical protein